MKFGKTLDYSMMLTAPLRESLHPVQIKLPKPMNQSNEGQKETCVTFGVWLQLITYCKKGLKG